MKDELVCQFTWSGGFGTETFSDTKLVNIMYGKIYVYMYVNIFNTHRKLNC